MARNVEVLAGLVRDVHRGLFLIVRNTAADQGMSAPGMRVMGDVMDHPGTTVGEISRKKKLAKSHISHAVAMMEKAGFIEKRQDPSDQRLVRLYPTAKAKRHFDTLRSAMDAKLTEILSSLSDEQIEAILDTLMTLRATLRPENSKLYQSSESHDETWEPHSSSSTSYPETSMPHGDISMPHGETSMPHGETSKEHRS